MLWPSEVLPTPGGPTKHRIGLLPCGIELAHREVLEDAPLDLVEAVVVRVEDRARLRDVDRLLASAPTTAARRASRGTCAPSSARSTARASARGAAAPCAPASRPPRASSPSAIAWRSSSSSARCVSSSPSSFLIVFNCSRSSTRAGARRACLASARRSRATASAPRRGASGARSRDRAASATSSASRMSCFSAGLMSISPPTMSASAPGDSMFCSAGASSAAPAAAARAASTALCFDLQHPRLDVAASSAPDRGSARSAPPRNGQPSMNSTTRKRCSPWQTR